MNKTNKIIKNNEIYLSLINLGYRYIIFNLLNIIDIFYN